MPASSNIINYTHMKQTKKKEINRINPTTYSRHLSKKKINTHTHKLFESKYKYTLTHPRNAHIAVAAMSISN